MLVKLIKNKQTNQPTNKQQKQNTVVPAKVAILSDFISWVVGQNLDDRHQEKNWGGALQCRRQSPSSRGSVCAAGCANFLMILHWERGPSSPCDVNQHCYFESSGVTVTYTSWVFWQDCIICHTVLWSCLKIWHYTPLNSPDSFNRRFSCCCKFVFWPRWFYNVLSNWKPAAGISN